MRGDNKLPRRRRRWTEAEEACLEQRWGTADPARIARSLGRTLGAVRVHAYRVMRLGPVSLATDRISARTLHRAIRGPGSNNLHPEEAFARLGLASRRVRNGGKTEYMIRQEDFWAWARGHMDYINLEHFTPGALGKEPEWMAAQREKRRGLKAKWQPWTEAEKRALRGRVEAGATIREAAALLGRSERSVEYQIKRMGKLRAVTEPKRPWSERERMRAAGLARAGYGTAEIARILGRPPEATRQAINRIMRHPFYGDW